MSDLKHTQGEWRYGLEKGYDHIISNGTHVARIYQRSLRTETLANAKLMAAAPTMLSALIKARDLAVLMGTNRALKEMNEAIEKATV